MSYNLPIQSFAINAQTGHLILTYVNGTTNDLGLVVGQAGASGDLYTPIPTKTGSYTLVAGDLTGTSTPEFEINAASGSNTFTIDPALLYNATSGQSLAVMVKRDPTDTSANTVTVTPRAGSTIEGLASGIGQILPPYSCYLVIAKNATTLRII